MIETPTGQTLEMGLDTGKVWEHEESAQKALLLKRKELKWKLMEASQIQNQAKLDEIKEEVEYNKKKMIRIVSLASKLRAKFLKVAKVAKTAEAHFRKVENQLLKQEKYVADEKMQITKLAVDCRDIGTQLYGPEYKLIINSRIARDKERQLLALKLKATRSDLKSRMIELKKKAKIKSPSKRTSSAKKESVTSEHPTITRKPPSTRLSSIYDLKDSPLRSLASYRLTTLFSDTASLLTDLSYTHNICPNCYVCLPDLISSPCADKNCLYQHKSNYLMTDIDKLADILSYKPSLTGFKADSNLTQEENDFQCRIKLKQYAAKLLAKNSDKPVETVAQNLVKYVRANRSDHELLMAVRELPKVSHLVCNIPEESNTIELDEVRNISGGDVNLAKLEEPCPEVEKNSEPVYQKRARWMEMDNESHVEVQNINSNDPGNGNEIEVKFC